MLNRKLSYAGPEHARCNQATKSHQAERDEWWDDFENLVSTGLVLRLNGVVDGRQ